MESDLEIDSIYPDVARQRMFRLPQGSGRRVGRILHDIPAISFDMHRIDVKLYQVAKQSSERFQNAAVQVLVILFVEHFEEVVNAHDNSNQLFGIAPKIGHQPVKFPVVGNEDVYTESPQRINAREKIRII